MNLLAKGDEKFTSNDFSVSFLSSDMLVETIPK